MSVGWFPEIRSVLSYWLLGQVLGYFRSEVQKKKFVTRLDLILDRVETEIQFNLS